LSALFSLDFRVAFLGRISWLSGVVGWLVVVLPLMASVLLILIRLNCWVVGEICLVSFQRKLFSVSVFSLIFIVSLAIFFIALGPFYADIFFVRLTFVKGFEGKFNFPGRRFFVHCMAYFRRVGGDGVLSPAGVFRCTPSLGWCDGGNLLFAVVFRYAPVVTGVTTAYCRRREQGPAVHWPLRASGVT